MDITFTQQMSKVKQLSDAISQAISSNRFKEGERLPSINELSQQYNVSRDTVFKAFNELKAKGIIDSTPAKGYYVSNAVVNVLLLLDIYSPFKSELHDELTRNLPMNYKIDLYFHQYNEERFNKIVNDSIGRYNLYLVMNLQNDVYSEVLDRIDPHKLMLIDFGKFEKERFAYVCQGFDTTLYECMTQGLTLFAKYNKIVFVFPDHSEHPSSCVPYFERFCRDFGFKYQICKTLSADMVEPNVAYLLVKHSHLIDFMKICRDRNYCLGSDVGVVIFNDEPMFEVLDNGITTISTDFKMMGRVASEFIKSRKKIQTYIPTQLIVRGSL